VTGAVPDYRGQEAAEDFAEVGWHARPVLVG
jgi:hypothetical protein